MNAGRSYQMILKDSSRIQSLLPSSLPKLIASSSHSDNLFVINSMANIPLQESQQPPQ